MNNVLHSNENEETLAVKMLKQCYWQILPGAASPQYKMYLYIPPLLSITHSSLKMLLADSGWCSHPPIPSVSPPRQSGFCSPAKPRPGRRRRQGDATSGGEKYERCGRQSRREQLHLLLVSVLHLLPRRGGPPPFSHWPKVPPSGYHPKWPKM